MGAVHEETGFDAGDSDGVSPLGVGVVDFGSPHAVLPPDLDGPGEHDDEGLDGGQIDLDRSVAFAGQQFGVEVGHGSEYRRDLPASSGLRGLTASYLRDTYMYMVDKRRVEDDSEFLASYDPNVFPRPSLAVDVVVASVRAGRLCALLVRRAEQPQKDRWALPGGFVGMDESLDAAARRVLSTKGGLEDLYLEQLYTFGDPGRDPRTRVVSVVYMALVDLARLEAAAGQGSTDRCVADVQVSWDGETGGPVDALDTYGASMRLAFDHSVILGMAVLRLRGKLDYAPVGFELLPEEFTLRRLQDIHEAVSGRRVNKDSFRRRMLAGGQLEATGARESDVAYRPAELYRFVRRAQSKTTGRRNDG